MKKKLLLLFPFCILLGITLIHAQTGSWAELGSGIAKKGQIYSVIVDDTGYVYACGLFENASGNAYVAKWNGATWSELGGANSLTALGNFKSNASIEYDLHTMVADKLGNIYVGGSLADVNSHQFVAKWNGSNWSKVQSGSDTLPLNVVGNMALDNLGNLYAAGANESNTKGDLICKWNGSTWSTLTSLDSIVYALVTDNVGNLYAAGTIYNGNKQFYVGKWNGTSWSELGTGANALNVNGKIKALAVDNVGNVYAAGNFTDANGVYYVAMWNGTTWSELGTGANAINADGLGLNGPVYALATDRSGNVYMGGAYYYSFFNVWQWNGTTWNQLGIGNNGLISNSYINTIAVDNLENVYAAGQFTDPNLYFEVQKWTATNVPTASVAPQVQSGIAVYPNPGSGQVSVNVPEQGSLRIYSVTGEQIIVKQIESGNSLFDLSALPTGMYTLLFAAQNSVYSPVKWIKE